MDDSPLEEALRNREPSADGNNGEGSYLGTAATLIILGAAVGSVLSRAVTASLRTPEQEKAEATAVAETQAQTNALTARQQHSERLHALRTQKLHLYQFEYAWGLQAYLRMAGANFEEHNLR